MKKQDFIKLQIGACEVRLDKAEKYLSLHNINLRGEPKTLYGKQAEIFFHMCPRIDGDMAELQYWKDQLSDQK